MQGQASADASRPPNDSGLHTEIVCPQPIRAAPPLSNPSSPGEDTASRGGGYGVDEAGNELRQVFHEPRDDEHGGGWKKPPPTAIDHHRPLSGVSTSVGATPGPESRASPHPWPPTPDSNASPGAAAGGDAGYLGKGGGRRLSLSGIGAGSGSEGSAKSEARDAHGTGGAASGGPPKQAGKVFVGGVPQDMNQDDLYTIFNGYGPVKKAWLQSYRTAGRVSNQSPPHNHRGFGFVIFYDGSAVDALLGKDFSRFLPLEGGRRLEVKKAVPSSDLPGKPAPHTSSVVGRIGASTAGAAIYHHRGSADTFPQVVKAVDNTRPAQLAPAALLQSPTQMVQTAAPWQAAAQQGPAAPSDWQWFRNPQMPATAVPYPADMRVAGYPIQAAGPTPFTSPAPQPATPWPTYMASPAPNQQQQQQQAQPMMMPNCVPNAAHALQPAQSMMLPVQWPGAYPGFMQPIASAPMQHQQQAVGVQMGLQQQQHAFHQQGQMQQLTLPMQPVQVSSGSRILDS